jgi:site-specific DNA recombinase
MSSWIARFFNPLSRSLWMKVSKTLRVALYARVSSERQAEEGTIASQIAGLRQRIVADGQQIDAELEFVDDGFSGATLLRPALERLRDQAAQGVLDRLYVYAPDRLARNYAYQFLLVDEFRRAGVEMVFLNRALGQSPEDDLLLQVQGIIAEYERAKIGERSRRGRLHAARTGQVSVLSGAPYGYRYVRKQEGGGQARYEIVAEAARVVQQIFAWVARERLSLREVCRRLAEQGQPSPAGRPRWGPSGVANLLRNPAYQGQAAYGRRRVVPRPPRLRPGRGQNAVPRQPYSITRQGAQPIFISVPALVSEEDFAAVAEQLAENQKRRRYRRAGVRYLLQGLLVCARCGYAFVGISTPRPQDRKTYYSFYRCISCASRSGERARPCGVRQVHAGRLEQAVWQDVCSLLKHPQKIEEEYQRRLHSQPGERPARGIEPLTRVMAKLKRSISRLVDLYTEGLLEKQELEPRLRAAKERLSQLEAEEQQLAAQETEQAELRLALSRLQDFAQRVEEGLERADWTTRRDVICALVKRIEITDREVRIVYRVAPVPFVECPPGGIWQDCPNGRVRTRACKTKRG